MVFTYVVAPNFGIEPPPVIPRAADLPPDAAPADTIPAGTPHPLNSPYSDTLPIQLGDILNDPFGAEWRPLNKASRTPINPRRVEKPSDLGGFKDTRRNLFEGRLGVMASLLAALNLGADVNISIYWQRRSLEVIEVKSLETRTFDVDDAYIEDVLVSEGVKEHLRKHPRDNLYIVTGLKVAKGARQLSDTSTTVGADAGAGDATQQIANIEALKLALKRGRRTSFQTATDFVMAVRLRRIKLGREGELVKHYLSLQKTTMEDGTPKVKEGEDGKGVAYNGMDDDLEEEKQIFSKDLQEMSEKVGDEEDVIFLPDLSDDEEDDE